MTDPHDDDFEFWHDGGGRTDGVRRVGRDLTGQIRRIARDHEDRHRFERTREHRVVRSADARPVVVNAYDYDLEETYAGLGTADHTDDALWAGVDAWVEPEVRARRDGATIDPRLLRLGAIAAAAVVLLPVAVALAAGDETGDGSEVRSETIATAAPPAAEVAEDPSPSTIPITAAASSPATTAGDNPADDDQQDAAASADGVADKSSPRAAEPACAGTYTVVAGDYWLRLADDTGAGLNAWLDANDATTETPLYAGDELCIPEGASAPAPPATAAPTTATPTTAAARAEPTTTDAPTTTAAPTTDAPARTTEPPRTTEPAPPRTTDPPPRTTDPPARPTPPETTQPPPGDIPTDVEGIIRHIFPDDEEDYAITIARRESGLDPRAYNGWCCYGLFQMYYRVHADWMRGLGIDSAEDLYDPYKNTLAAYTLWRESGWDAWSTHG